MFYSMTRFLLLVAVLIISVVQGAPITDDTIKSCDAQFYSTSECYGTVSSFGNCKTSTLNLANTNISTCTSARLFWSYPVDNLTMIIETPFTQKQQPYTIYFDNKRLNGGVEHVYRVFNGQETEVTTTDDKLIQYSDANYQVILKLQGPPSLMYYGTFINYEITGM